MIHFMAYRATEHTENKKAETLARLTNQAKAIVSNQGFRALSIAAVAAQAGIATGTVYRYFPSKSQLCVAIFEQATQREIEAVQQASEQPANHIAKIRAALSTFIERAQRNPTLAYALIAEPVDPELEQVRLQYRKTWASAFAKLLEQGVEAQAFYLPNPQVTAAALVGAMAEAIIISKQDNPKTNALKNQHTDSDINTNTSTDTETGTAILHFCMRAVLGKEEQTA